MPMNQSLLYTITFIPMLFSFFGSVYFTIRIVIVIKREEMTVSSSYIVKAVIAYPVIMFVSWLPTLISVLDNLLTDESGIVVYFIAILIPHLQGFFNSFYFIFINTSKNLNAPSTKEDEEDDISFANKGRSISKELYRNDSF